MIESYLSHTSAALYWKIPYLHVVYGYLNIEVMALVQTKEERSYLNKSFRKRKDSEISYIRSVPMPKGAIRVCKGKAIASPELLFLDLAEHLSFHQHVLLGMQLCASSPSGGKSLTTKRKLMRFLSACERHKGVKQALTAATYICDNSWSIMESLLFMMLSLPHKYGGYGFGGVELNCVISLSKQPQWQKTNTVYADLLWRREKLVVEYDSYEYHNSKNVWVRDARKATALECDGYKALSVNTTQIYSDYALSETAQVIAGCLNKRMRMRAPQFAEQKMKLRSLLPRLS